jgi:poly-gamma-glutamate capsule biosynthesis protein CapA/YwtB (metallophosphatase superfamily)
MGHHPHVRQPWEWYGGGAIFYSLGNLIFDQFQRTETQIGLLAELVFEGTQIVQARTRPVNIVLTVRAGGLAASSARDQQEEQSAADEREVEAQVFRSWCQHGPS